MSISSSNISRMYLFNFLLNMHLISGVMIPFLTQWGNISFFQVMVLQSFFMISIFILEIPTGAMADYLGRKQSIMLSACVNAAAALVYSSHPSFHLFMVGEFMWAFAVTLLSGADEALVYDSLKMDKREKDSKKVFGRLHSFVVAAIMVSAPIGSYIAITIGLRYSMMLIVVPCLLAAVVGSGLQEPVHEKERETSTYLSMVKSGLAYFRGNRILRLMAFESVLVNNLVFLLIWIYQPLLGEMNISLFYFGFVSSGMTATEIIFLNNFERLETACGSKRRYLVISALVPGICFLVLSASGHVAVSVLLFLLIAGFGMPRLTLYKSYMNKHIESHNRATVLSAVSMIGGLSRSLIYLIFGVLVEWSLHYTLIIVGAFLIVIPLSFRIKEEYLID